MTKNDKKLHIFNFSQNIKIIEILNKHKLIELYKTFKTSYIKFFISKKITSKISIYRPKIVKKCLKIQFKCHFLNIFHVL